MFGRIKNWQSNKNSPTFYPSKIDSATVSRVLTFGSELGYFLLLVHDILSQVQSTFLQISTVLFLLQYICRIDPVDHQCLYFQSKQPSVPILVYVMLPRVSKSSVYMNTCTCTCSMGVHTCTCSSMARTCNAQVRPCTM